LRGLRSESDLVTPIAIEAPRVERIRRTERTVLRDNTLGSGESDSLLGMDDHILRPGRSLGLTFAHLHDRRVAFVIHLDAILARPQQRQRQIRRIDFDVIVRIQRAHAHVHHAGRDAHLDRVVVDIEEREAGVASKAHGGPTHVHFHAGVVLGPKLVARGQRTIDHCSGPLLLTCGLQ
jgi:hypothetical protein